MDLFRAHGFPPVRVTPSPVIWRYRNRLDFSFGRRFYDTPPPKGFVRETALGFRRRGRWFHLLDIRECRIGPAGMDALLLAVRDWVSRSGLSGFDSRTHEGVLKLLLVREGKRTGERMVVLVTGDGVRNLAAFRDAVLSVYPVDSLHHAISQSPAGVAYAEQTIVLHGRASISEHLCIPTSGDDRVLRFRITPFSFFQTNPLAAEILYSFVRDWVAALSPRLLYDLYGGNGAVAFACADLVPQVVSVESVPDVQACGEDAVQINGIGNVTFVCAKVEDFLRDRMPAAEAFPDDSAVIVDPPRAGLHPRALRRLLALRPRHLIYVSCKPEVLARQEMPALLEHYRVLDARAVDMFPHTPHVEAVVLFAARP